MKSLIDKKVKIYAAVKDVCLHMKLLLEDKANKILHAEVILKSITKGSLGLCSGGKFERIG